MVKIEDLKKLRDLTGISIEACRQALQSAEDNIEKALEFLKARGESVAEKKSGRATNQGRIEAYIHGNGKIGVLVKLLSETDFVARNELFVELAHDIALHIAASNPGSVDELLVQPFVKDQDITVGDLIKNYIAKLGENIKVGEFCRLSL